MYNKLKKLLAMITILFIALLGLLFLKNYQNQLFGGQREVVSVEKSTINFNEEIKKIARDNDSLIAQRIVDTKNNFSGEVENTYVPIGKGKLPSNLPLQKNKKLIKNSPVNTLYIIVEGRLTAKELAKKLNALNNQAIVFPTNYRLILLKLLSSIPQVLMIILVLLIAFSSLILAEYISNIRSIGIRRLSGEGKHTIALQSTYKDSLFLIVYTLVILFSIIIVLKIFNFLSIECFLVITFPILCWLFLLLIINFFLSNLFYYILQNQPINLSIKGKAPMKLIYLMVFVMQIFTLASLMYCVYGVHEMNNELSLLQAGKHAWEKYPQLFQITQLDDGDSITKEKKREAYKQLYHSIDMMIIQNNLDSIASSTNPDQTSNVLYVSNTFIKYSPIKLSKQLRNKINNLSPFENFILIPETQKNNYSFLKKKWINNIENEAKSSAEDNKVVNANIKTTAGLYENSANVFVYPVFSNGGQLTSNECFVHHPIIVVGTPYSNLAMYPDGWNVRITQPTKVTEFIKKNNLTSYMGSLTNGLFSINEKFNSVKNKKEILLISTIISIVCSILLLMLINTIYFYQGRKKFFIERLAGKSMLAIHKNYLIVVVAINVFITLICLFLRAYLLVTLTPIIYLLLILSIFSIQLKREKQLNILYLKGE